MNAAERRMVTICERATRMLLSGDVELEDASLVQFLCARVREICAGGADVEELTARRLAATSAELAAAIVGRYSGCDAAEWERRARSEWLSARGELLEIRLGVDVP